MKSGIAIRLEKPQRAGYETAAGENKSEETFCSIFLYKNW